MVDVAPEFNVLLKMFRNGVLQSTALLDRSAPFLISLLHYDVRFVPRRDEGATRHPRFEHSHRLNFGCAGGLDPCYPTWMLSAARLYRFL